MSSTSKSPSWPYWLGGGVLALVLLKRFAGAAAILPRQFLKIAAGWGEPRLYRAGTHYGVDFVAPIGTPVFSRQAGRVVIAHPYADSNAGKWIAVEHSDGSTWEYMHLSRVDVQVGQSVTKGQRIGLSGNTMNPVMSSEAHLHLTVRLNPGALRAYAARWGTPSGGFGSENERGTAVPAEIYFA